MMKKILMVGVITLAASSVAEADGFYMGAGLGGLELKNHLTDTVTDNEVEPPKTTEGTAKGSKLGVNGTILGGYAWESPDSYFIGLEAFDNESTAKTSAKKVMTPMLPLP